jgi:predicted nucleic acid-binding protein
MLADTAFLIDLMVNDSAALGKAKQLEQAGVPISVGAPTIFELYIGVSLSKTAQKEKSKIISALSTMTQVPFDQDSGDRCRFYLWRQKEVGRYD